VAREREKKGGHDGDGAVPFYRGRGEAGAGGPVGSGATGREEERGVRWRMESGGVRRPRRVSDGAGSRPGSAVA
jgi:hypothetical protein